jgi:hypothetical protein
MTSRRRPNFATVFFWCCSWSGCWRTAPHGYRGCSGVPRRPPKRPSRTSLRPLKSRRRAKFRPRRLAVTSASVRAATGPGCILRGRPATTASACATGAGSNRRRLAIRSPLSRRRNRHRPHRPHHQRSHHRRPHHWRPRNRRSPNRRRNSNSRPNRPNHRQRHRCRRPVTTARERAIGADSNRRGLTTRLRRFNRRHRSRRRLSTRRLGRHRLPVIMASAVAIATRPRFHRCSRAVTTASAVADGAAGRRRICVRAVLAR